MSTSFRLAALATCFAISAFSFGQRLRNPLRGGNGAPPPSVGTWTRGHNLPNTQTGLGLSLLLTDGTVIVQGPESRNWWKLTPNASGSYVDGTWTQIANTPSGYAPLYFASSVLADGRVVVLGGEYNVSGGGTWTNKGAIYNPLTNTWANLSAPPGWANIGDAQCTVLPDKRFLLAMPFDTRISVLDPATLTWTNLNSTGKADRHDEEGWALLPDGTILTVDALHAPSTEKYIPWLDLWISAGSTPQSLEDPGSQEIGPMVRRPDGTVFAMGATGHNAVYTPGALPTDPGTWVAAPDFPNIGGQLDIADGPACLLTNGNVLCDTSPGVFNTPSHFFEFNGTTLTQVPDVPNSGVNSSFVGNMLMLPNGQVMFTDFSNDVQFYTSTGTFQEAWRPTITDCPSTIQQSLVFTLTGTQLNGLSQCTGYGDDSTNFTNYPLVRIKNLATGHVKYCRTHDHSTMAIATGSTPVTTIVDVPASAEIGASTLEVVTNGIPSVPTNVNVVEPGVVLPTSYNLVRGQFASGNLQSLAYVDSDAFTVRTGPVLNSTEAPIQVEFSAQSNILNPTAFTFTGTSKVSTGNLEQKIYLFNFQTSAYELVDTRAAGTSNSTYTVSASGSMSRFVNQTTKQIKAKLSVYAVGPILSYPYQTSIDSIRWTIN